MAAILRPKVGNTFCDLSAEPPGHSGPLHITYTYRGHSALDALPARQLATCCTMTKVQLTTIRDMRGRQESEPELEPEQKRPGPTGVRGRGRIECKLECNCARCTARECQEVSPRSVAISGHSWHSLSSESSFAHPLPPSLVCRSVVFLKLTFWRGLPLLLPCPCP